MKNGKELKLARIEIVADSRKPEIFTVTIEHQDVFNGVDRFLDKLQNLSDRYAKDSSNDYYLESSNGRLNWEGHIDLHEEVCRIKKETLEVHDKNQLNLFKKEK